jgi:hypothetical protein
VVGEGFNADKDVTPTSHFKIESILSDDQARSLSKKGMVPDWMLIIDAADEAAAAAAAEELFTFEAEEDEEEESEESDDSGVISHSNSSSAAAGGGSAKKKGKERKEEPIAFSRKDAKEAASRDDFNVDDI